jgi:hypothetical protein
MYSNSKRIHVPACTNILAVRAMPLLLLLLLHYTLARPYWILHSDKSGQAREEGEKGNAAEAGPAGGGRRLSWREELGFSLIQVQTSSGAGILWGTSV